MPQLAVKPLSWFKTNPQVRKHFDEEELRQLGESLKARQLQPVLCQPDGTIIAGERRYRAAVLVEMESLEAKIAEEHLSEGQVKVWQLVENMQRADLTPYEQWTGCAELMCMHPTWQMKDLAERLNLDPSSITRLLSPSKCTAEWQDAIRDGKVGISDCYAASKLPQAKQNGLLALKLSGASRDALEEAGRKERAPKAESSIKLARVRCPLATGAAVVVSGLEMSLDELIETLGYALEAAKKASKAGWTIETAQKVWRDRAKAG